MPGPLRARKCHAYRPYVVQRRGFPLGPRLEKVVASVPMECDDTTTTTNTTTTTTTAATTANTLLSLWETLEMSSTLQGEEGESSFEDSLAFLKAKVVRVVANPRKRKRGAEMPTIVTLPRCSTPPALARPSMMGLEVPPPLLLPGEEAGEYEGNEEVENAFALAFEDVEREEEDEEMKVEGEEEEDVEMEEEEEEEEEEERDVEMEERVEDGLEQQQLQSGDAFLARIQALSQESVTAKVARLRETLLRKRQVRKVRALLAQQDQWLLPKLQRQEECRRVRALLQRQDECLQKEEVASSEAGDASMEEDTAEPSPVEDASMEDEPLLLVEEEDWISEGGLEEDFVWADGSDDESLDRLAMSLDGEEEEGMDVEEDEEAPRVPQGMCEDEYDPNDSILLLIRALSQ